MTRAGGERGERKKRSPRARALAAAKERIGGAPDNFTDNRPRNAPEIYILGPGELISSLIDYADNEINGVVREKFSSSLKNPFSRREGERKIPPI